VGQGYFARLRVAAPCELSKIKEDYTYFIEVFVTVDDEISQSSCILLG
jgi:hypothetical protein